MPDTEISNLPAADPLTGAEILPITQGGVTKRTTLTDAAGLIAAATTTQNWQSPYRGALASLSADIINLTSGSNVPFSETVYDTDGIWNVGNPSRLTVPAGVSRVRITASMESPSAGFTNNSFTMRLSKNGLNFKGMATQSATLGFNNEVMSFSSAVIDVIPGDYFEVRLFHSQDMDLDVNTSFGMEIVEATDAEARPYDLTGTVLGIPTVSAIVDQHVMSRTTRMLLDGGSSQYYASTAPSADTDFDVQKNGGSIGTLTFLSGSNTGSYVGAQTDFVSGDRIALVSPANVNGIADVSFNHRMVLV